MKFLDDMRNQPQSTREIMFGLSVFITVLLAGLVWFHSFQRNLYVLLNPEDGLEKALAIERAPMPSLFGYVGQSAGQIKGLVLDLLGQSGQQSTDSSQLLERMRVESVKVYTLPLSGQK